MTRGRSRIRHQSSRKSTDENDHSQTGQGEEIANPQAQCTSPIRGRPEEFREINSSNTLQTEEPGIGNDSFYAASAVSPNAIYKVPRVPLFTVDRIAEPEPNAAQTLEDQQFEDTESQQQYLDCLTPIWHRDLRVFARKLEEYSNKAHLSALKAAVQYSETHLQSQDDEGPDYEPSDQEDDYSCLQNPTKTPIISKDFLRALPLCPIIHCPSQMCNNPKLCFCSCSSHYGPWREKNKIFIHDDHECKTIAMTC
jgi:hypothetical protein